MVLDYSKWDALELSDDSDIEVHPNVDKKSFIRAKQNQIHQQRYERRHQIETLKYERVVNDGLLERIDALLESLRKHEKDAKTLGSGPDIFIMQALMEASSTIAGDEPPKPPEGVYSKQEQPRYSQMMASLVDQVKKEVGDKADNWYTSYEKGIEGHQLKVRNLQKELLEKLNELEREEGRKITSDSIYTGFDKSSVSKEKQKSKGTSTAKPKSSKPKAETVEVLNPGSQKPSLPRSDSVLSSGAEADVDEPIPNASEDLPSSDEEEEESIEPSSAARQFASIELGDYKASLRFISSHHEIVTEREQDGLLMEAFTAQQENNPTYAKQCVHQALLLQYCRSLGKDGVGLFFTRIQTPGHQAQKVFQDDVNTTYTRIANRVAELAKQHGDTAGGTEQIQLHAVEPGTQIHINIPQPGSSEQVEIDAREIFESFPPGLQKALESGSLDRVNEVLGKMSVEEAEEVVAKLGEAGMLSLEQGVIDGTTEEGREKLKELEEQAARDKEEEQRNQHGKPVEKRLEEIDVADPD